MIETNHIYVGDCQEIMSAWPDGFVQACVTSPPYWGLRDYGVPGQLGLENTPDAYVKKMVEVFREVRRVLRDDGTLWLNLGDSYAASGKGLYADGNSYREGEKQKTNVGSIGVRMRTKEGDAGHTHGVKPPPGLKAKDLVGIPWRVAFALQADGWYLRSDIIWAKPNPMPESVTDRPTKAHEYLFLMAKAERYYYDAGAIKEKASFPNGANWPESIKSPYGQGFTRANQRSPSGWKTGPGSHTSLVGRHDNREFDKGKKSLSETQAHLGTFRDKQRGHSRRHDGFNDRWDLMEKAEQCSGMRNKRSVWTVATSPFPEAHFATFPAELIKPCVLAGSMGGGA